MATENTGANENKKAGEAAKRPRPVDPKAPVKKKKIIIVTGNSSSSRQGSGQRGAYSSSSGSYSTGGTGAYSAGGPRKPRPAGQHSGQGQSAPRRENAGAGARPKTDTRQPQHKIIRPSVKPTQMEVDFRKPVAPVRQPKKVEEPVLPAKEIVIAQEKAAEAVPQPVQPAENKIEMPAAAVSEPAAPAAQVVSEPAVPVETVVAEEPKVKEEKTAESKAAEVTVEMPAVPKAVNAPLEKKAVEAEAPSLEKSEEKPSVEKPSIEKPSAEKPAEMVPEKAEEKKAAEEKSAEVLPALEKEIRQEQPDRAKTQAPQREKDSRAAVAKERTAQGQSGTRREGRGGEQGGFRQNRGTGEQGGFRQNRGTGEQGGFRQNRTGDEQGVFGGRGAKPGQGMRGAAQGAGRPAARAGAPDTGRRRPGGKAGDGEGFSRESEKHRDDNKRKMNQERDKRSKKDLIYNEEDTRRRSTSKAGKFIRPEKKVESAAEEQIKTITIPEKLTIRELADAMHMNPSEIIKKLFLAGRIMTPNSEVEYEEAEKIALDYDILCEKEQKVDVIEELLREEDDAEESLETRPPVICVMGHVDHGKTSLLDAIRKTNVTRGEAGGITQAIGAYTVTLDGRSITFLDTPGHEAFTAMRMRGANSTDIAVLVIAADDGVMPQTVEAINHAKAAGVEIIVAINKIDKPGANIERVKQELTEYELVPTDWGGATEFVPVSAKTGEGIEDLLETILLTADILELKANPNRKARGLVLEAKLDKGRGPVANVLIQKGTLHIGDFISAGASSGKVRAMIDDKGRRIKEAKPSQPVEILGLSDVPSAGEVIIAHETNDEAKTYAETYKNQHKEELIEDTKMRMNLDDLFNQMKEGNLKEFNLIIKADVQGSVEALKQSLLKLSNEEVVVKVIHGGVGAINESDVTLASASNAVIIGFNVRPDATAKAMAEHEGVDIRLYKVIYQAIDAVEAALKGMLAPIYEERVIGHVEVRMLFKASAVGNIAGSYVLDGVIRRGCKCRITRDGEQIFEGDLASLKRFKDDVKEVKAGFECGLVFSGFDKMQVGDIVEAYDLVEVPRT